MSESHTERERQLLRGALAEGHRSGRRRTPPFEELWSRAVAESSAALSGRRRGPRIRLAVAAAAVAVLVVASTIALWTESRRSRQLDVALSAAAAVGEWRAPLDFLLDTPGREWLAATPSWDPRAAAGPRWDLAPELLESEPLNPDST